MHKGYEKYLPDDFNPPRDEKAIALRKKERERNGRLNNFMTEMDTVEL